MRKFILTSLLAAATIVPSVATAQDREHGDWGNRGGRQAGAPNFQPRGIDPSAPRFQRSEPQQRQWQQPQPQPTPQPQQQRFQPPVAVAPVAPVNGGPGGGWRGDRGGRGGWNGQPPVQQPQVQQPQAQVPPPQFQQQQGRPGGWNGNRDGDRRPDWRGDNRRGPGGWQGNDGARDPNGWRGTSDAQRGRDGWRGDNRWVEQRGGGRDYYNNGRGFYDRDGRGGWNNGWRNDRRYDWRGYRDYNRNLFHLPRYYAPYGWGYGYQRFSIGIALNALLYSDQYWIDDPEYYRLPEAYGPYRWVRYYNDALLVDIYTGTVVDVVYDIFW